MNPNQTPEHNVPQTATAQSARELSSELPIAFIAGLQIEELYCIFGEPGLLLAGGFTPELKTKCENKLASIERCLSWLNVANDFSQLAQAIRQSSDQNQWQSKPNLETIGALQLVARKIADAIGRFMGYVRKQLNDVEGLRYDVGIFVARLSLCMRYVCASSGADATSAQLVNELRPLYVKELKRTADTLTDVLAKGLAGRALGLAFTPEIVQKISTLASQLGKNDAAQSPQYLWALSIQLETIIGKAGFEFVPPPAPDSPR